MAGKRPRRRKIRKVTTYVCTGCYKTFPSGKEANAHHAETHPAPPKPVGRRGRRRRGRKRLGGRRSRR